jgi:hypothetical protein
LLILLFQAGWKRSELREDNLVLAFEVAVDGKPFARAGAEDWAVLTCIVTADRSMGRRGALAHDDLRLRVGGLSQRDKDGVSYHLRWGNSENLLTVGSEITLRVIETAEVDPPRRRHFENPVNEESPYTKDEERQSRYRDYLELKAEFEPSQD